MTHANALRKTLTISAFLVCLFIAGPAFAVSVHVQVNTTGQQPDTYVGATVTLGVVTVLVNAEGVATFDDVEEGEYEIVVNGRNIHHRTELVQVTEGVIITIRVTHVSALTSGRRFQVGAGYSSLKPKDWEIDESTKTSTVTLYDINGNIVFQGEFDDPTTNETILVGSSQTGPVLTFTVLVAETGANRPWWGALYLTPMYGEVDAEISFRPDAGAPGCDCGYSGSGSQWGIGAEAVIKPHAARRFFFSIELTYRETDALDVNVAPGFPGVISSMYTLKFKQNNATLLFGFDGNVIAPFAGFQRIAGDATLTGDDTADAFIVDSSLFFMGETLQTTFVNRFRNDAWLGVAGLKFRIPKSRISGLARWAGDSGNNQFDLLVSFSFGGR